jgi:putative ATP-dependent endonuclease of OLD family
MKITKIRIKNYKSVKELNFKPNTGLNAFIGENNTGKSNVFDAINWLLGPTYPTFNSTKKSDHYLGDEKNKIFISLEFDNGYTFELDESKSKYNFSILKNGQYQRDVNREQFCCAYIGNERTIVDYLPSDRWSLLGRLLQDINKKFLEEKIQDGEKEVKKSEKLKEDLDKIRDNLLFSVENAEGKKIMSDFINIIKKESAEQLNRSIDDFEVNLNLYDPWDFYRTLQIIVNEKDIGLKFQASQLGMGAQASITVAILKAYSEIKLGGENPIFIDELELFLHPQAQRNFYKILRELAKDKNIQIFYTTHSPYFL